MAAKFDIILVSNSLRDYAYLMDDNLRSRLRYSGPAHRPTKYGRPAVTAQPSQPLQTAPSNSDAVKTMPEPRSYSPPSEKAQSHPKKNKKRAKKERKTKKSRILLILTILAIILAFGLIGAYTNKSKIKSLLIRNKPTVPSSQSAMSETKTTPKQAASSGTLRFIAIGDILTFNSVNSAARTAGGYDYSPLLAPLKTFFNTSDVRLCTQSVPSAGESVGGINGYPVFNAPSDLPKSLVASGCNVVNVSSDHINDKGQPGIDATANLWKAQKNNILGYSGVNSTANERDTINYFSVKNFKFALLTYVTKLASPAASAFGTNQYSDEFAIRQLAEARKNADFVIVGIQWGDENKQDVSPEQDRIAALLAANSADLVIGNGPHVVQTTKILGGPNNHQTLVYFSLGNSLNSQLPINNLTSCMAVIDIELPLGSIVNPSCMPLYMHYEWSLAQKNRLSEADLLARTNLKLVPLDTATELLPKSQNTTTVQEQTDRIKAIVTQTVPIKMLTSKTF